MAEPICPVEMMAKVAWDEDERLEGNTWERFKKDFPEIADARMSAMRSALRALANMDPTLPMYEVTKLNGASPFSCVEHCKDYIMVAAAEGEGKGNG